MLSLSSVMADLGARLRERRDVAARRLAYGCDVSTTELLEFCQRPEDATLLDAEVERWRRLRELWVIARELPQRAAAVKKHQDEQAAAHAMADLRMRELGRAHMTASDRGDRVRSISRDRWAGVAAARPLHAALIQAETAFAEICREFPDRLSAHRSREIELAEAKAEVDLAEAEKRAAQEPAKVLRARVAEISDKIGLTVSPALEILRREIQNQIRDHEDPERVRRVVAAAKARSAAARERIEELANAPELFEQFASDFGAFEASAEREREKKTVSPRGRGK